MDNLVQAHSLIIHIINLTFNQQSWTSGLIEIIIFPPAHNSVHSGFLFGMIEKLP